MHFRAGVHSAELKRGREGPETEEKSEREER